MLSLWGFCFLWRCACFPIELMEHHWFYIHERGRTKYNGALRKEPKEKTAWSWLNLRAFVLMLDTAPMEVLPRSSVAMPLVRPGKRPASAFSKSEFAMRKPKQAAKKTQLAPLAHGSWEVESCKALDGGGGGGGGGGGHWHSGALFWRSSCRGLNPRPVIWVLGWFSAMPTVEENLCKARTWLECCE